MAVIHMDRKWLYLFEPHTASRCTSRSLQKAGFGQMGHHHIDIAGLTNWRREHIQKKQLNNFTIFCTIRNPFDVLTTMWKFSPYRDKPFSEYFEARKHADEIKFPLRGLYREANVILYYEHLQSDLSWVFSDMVKLEERNKHEVTPEKGVWSDHYRDQDEIVGYLLDSYGPFLSKYGYLVTYQGGELSCSIDQTKRVQWTRKVA